MLDLVLLAGMNCSPKLWVHTGLEGITPQLTQSSIDEQVRVLLDELPPTFALIGLSLGGIVAMSLAIRAPERVAALCVVSANAKAPTPSQNEGWQGWTTQLDRGRTPRQLQESIITSLLSEPARRRDPGLIERVLDMGDDVGPDVLHAQLAMQASRTNLRPELRSLCVPTLVVSGVDDVICPESYHVEITADVPGATMVSLEGGHLLPMENPRSFGGLLRGWPPLSA